jgi:hypothetical protein
MSFYQNKDKDIKLTELQRIFETMITIRQIHKNYNTAFYNTTDMSVQTVSDERGLWRWNIFIQGLCRGTWRRSFFYGDFERYVKRALEMEHFLYVGAP